MSLPTRLSLAFACAISGAFAMSVGIHSSADANAPVGSTVRLEATADSGEAPTWFRYRVRNPGASAFRVVRDFSPDPVFQWSPALDEGHFEVEVTAQNQTTGESATETRAFEITSRITDGQPVISRTTNELVFLYSAPACPAGSRMRVEFTGANGIRQFTPFRACAGRSSMNFYLAGLRSASDYTVRHVIQTGEQFEQGPALTLQVPALSLQLGRTLVVQKPSAQVREDLLLQGSVFQMPVATDIDGEVVWYYPYASNYFTRPEPGGYFFALSEKHDGKPHEQILRQFDLAGNTVFETNAGAINQQLAAMGKPPITSFHHEARSISEGRILVLAGSERILTDVQGEGQVDVIGDTILVLDRNLQVLWVWDSFDHLDPHRKAVLDEKCVPGGGGCPTFYLAPVANDWLHGNSLQLTPDGHILYSSRHQDWVIKIDYANGVGSGGVIWRLGKDGDFEAPAGVDWPWFSHQHDANYERNGGAGNRVVLFDNGNTRRWDDPEAHSRGQVWELDEVNRKATLVLNVDLGSYSLALGSAQRLSNGNYHFNSGWMPDNRSQALEYDPTGQRVSLIEVDTQQYRSFRMRDMYTP